MKEKNCRGCGGGKLMMFLDLDLKYVLKFEFRGLEQTYKVDKLEFVNISELESKLRSVDIESIKKRFEEMSDDLKLFYN